MKVGESRRRRDRAGGALGSTLRGSISRRVDPRGFFNPDIPQVGRESEEYLG